MKIKKKNTAKRLEIPFNEPELLESVSGLLAHTKAGTTATLRITDLQVPARLPGRSAAQIRAVRKKLGASQVLFATLLNVPLRTISSWENNQRKPSGAALRLLDIAERHPEVLMSA